MHGVGRAPAVSSGHGRRIARCCRGLSAHVISMPPSTGNATPDTQEDASSSLDLRGCIASLSLDRNDFWTFGISPS